MVNNKKKKNSKNKHTGARTGGTIPQDESKAFPNFHRIDKNVTVSENLGIYRRYKIKTSNFCNSLSKLLPHFKLKSVSDLKRATDKLCDDSIHSGSEILDEQQLIDDLKESIKLRKDVGKEYGDNDKGHRFMLETLEHCKRKLSVMRKLRREKFGTANDNVEVNYENFGRFQSLIQSEKQDEDEEEEEEIDTHVLRKGCMTETISSDELDYSIEDLINGDDRFQACCFLSSIEEHMSLVSNHFDLLKQTARERNKDYSKSIEGVEHSSSSDLQLLLECTVACNLAIESVQSMESSLAVDFPHLSSFYAVIAVVFLPNFIDPVEARLTPEQREKNLAKIFIGEIVECMFHNKGETKVPQIARKFARDTRLDVEYVEEQAILTSKYVTFELQLEVEEKINTEYNNFLKRNADIKPHGWMKDHHFIGGDRSILNTHLLLQKVFDAVQPNKKLVSRGGFFGQMWHEDSLPARRIKGDLDEVFAADILPEMIAWCRGTHSPIKMLPHREQLLTLLHVFANYIEKAFDKRNRRDLVIPIPISLSFGFHTVLTSLIQFQGDGDICRLAEITKRSFDKLFQQLEDILKSAIPNTADFYHNLKVCKQLAHMVKPIGQPSSKTSEMHSFWNPVIGGQFLLFATYVCSIGLGSACVDNMSQLRFTLHLYNAFQDQNLINQSKESLLEVLSKVFMKTKEIWVGGRPNRGRYKSNFSLSSGKRLAIAPESFSASCKRIINRDFSEDHDDYSVVNVTAKQKEMNKDFYNLISRVNMVRDSMDLDESYVIPINFCKVGSILNDFLQELSNVMGWDKIDGTLMPAHRMEGGKSHKNKNMNSQISKKNQALSHFIGELLGNLDDIKIKPKELSIDYNFASKFMEDFFGKIPRSAFTFFAEEDKEVMESISCRLSNISLQQRNPLLGSYPVGRTGRTSRDPLAVFFHFKLSKAGERVARLIKPGIKTPFIVAASPEQQRQRGFQRSDFISTPYEEVGSKMHPLPNGKYRHIASYSIEELILLGWDGAKYNSSTVGSWCPFICGYDSDSDDNYEPINVKAGKKVGTIGLLQDEVGLHMDVPGHGVVAVQK